MFPKFILNPPKPSSIFFSPKIKSKFLTQSYNFSFNDPTDPSTKPDASSDSGPENPSIVDEWGEKSGPEPEPTSKIIGTDPPIDDDEWSGSDVVSSNGILVGEIGLCGIPDNDSIELNLKLREKLGYMESAAVNHLGVLKTLSQALRKTETSYLQIADMMLMENPELSLMGSCVLVMVMKGDDVYLLNVGDSRSVLAKADSQVEKMKKQSEESLYGYEYEHTQNLSSY